MQSQRLPPSLHFSPILFPRHRPQSLQTIKINHRGLPHDFFHPLSARISTPKTRPPRAQTLPNHQEDLRVTPSFQYSLPLQRASPRQCHSQQRTQQVDKHKKSTSGSMFQSWGQITFSKAFLEKEKQPPKTISLNRIKKGQSARQQEGQLTAKREELMEAMKRKQIETGKRPYMLWERLHPKLGNRLPLLITKPPQARGS